MCGGPAANDVAPAIGPIDPALLATPLDYLEAENNRRRAALAQLDSIARGLPALVRSRLAPALGRYFCVDLPGHVSDVEKHLLPLLARRALPEDGVEKLTAALHEAHAAGLSLSGAIVPELGRLAHAREAAGDRFAAAVAALIAVQRRELATESEVMLPLARARLDSRDIRQLSRALARRRQRAAAPESEA